MDKLKELREKINHLATQANKLLADKGSATWTPEDQQTFDGYTNEIALLKAQVKAHEDLRAMDADKFFQAANGGGTAPERRENGTISPREAVALYLRHGDKVTAEQALAISNAMSTTTPSEGGYTVPSEIATLVIDAMKAYGGMREAAQLLATDGGGPLSFPTSDGTSEVGEIVSENTEASSGDITFGTVAVNPYTYSSKQIALPLQLVQDSAIDVVAFVINRLAERLGRITNYHYTVGTGSGQPYGLVPRVSSGKVGTTGQTLTVTYADLIDLMHSVNRAYRSRGKFMLNDLSVAVVRKLVDGNGRPIWTPGVSSGGLADTPPDTLLGRQIIINDDMPVMAANAKSIVFGDFSKYIIRDVKSSAMMRRFDDSAFATKYQVGFCGWLRTGGNLVDTNAVKAYANSAT